MNEIPPINNAARVTGVLPARPASEAVSETPAATTDHVEISQEAQALSEQGKDPSSRAERISEIRQQIKEGTYETPDKIGATVDRLLEVLKSPDQAG